MLSGRHAPYTPIRNVQRVRRRLADGRCNYHHYHRPTRTKLPGKPNSPEFMRVYWECERKLALSPVALTKACVESNISSQRHAEPDRPSSKPAAPLSTDQRLQIAIYRTEFWR
jgi:hypothetical protein